MRDPYEPIEGVTVVPTVPWNLRQSYVTGDEDAVLVDTGLRWSGRRLARAVQGIGVKSIALTHAHADHAGSAGWLADQLSVHQG